MGAAFVLIVVATVAARSIGGSSNAPETDDSAARSSRSSETPPLSAFGPQANAPEAPPAGQSQYAFIWPNDYYLVQGLWARHPLGIDLSSPEGDPVRAVRDGRVIFAGGDPCCNYGLRRQKLWRNTPKWLKHIRTLQTLTLTEKVTMILETEFYRRFKK